MTQIVIVEQENNNANDSPIPGTISIEPKSNEHKNEKPLNRTFSAEKVINSPRISSSNHNIKMNPDDFEAERNNSNVVKFEQSAASSNPRKRNRSENKKFPRRSILKTSKTCRLF